MTSGRTPSAEWPARSGPAALLCLALVLAASAPALAQAPPAPRLELGTPEVAAGGVGVDVTVAHLLEGEVLDALEAGLPATLLIEWRLWRERSGWWDVSVDRGADYLRIRFDVLSNRFSVFDARGRHLHGAADPAEVERALSRHLRLDIAPEKALEPGRNYVVEAMVRIEALDAEQVLNLEAWLRGDVGDGRSMLSGLSRRATGWLKKMVEPDSRRAWAESERFRVVD